MIPSRAYPAGDGPIRGKGSEAGSTGWMFAFQGQKGSILLRVIDVSATGSEAGRGTRAQAKGKEGGSSSDNKGGGKRRAGEQPSVKKAT